MRVLCAGLQVFLAAVFCGGAGGLAAAPPVTDTSELFARLDRNGDNRIEATELTAEHAGLFRLLLATADKDHDGALSRQEWTAGLKDSGPERPLEKLPDPPTPTEIARAMFRRYDGDRNHRLELKELPPRQQAAFRKLLTTHDKNQDGALNFQEFEGSYAQLLKESTAMPAIQNGPPDAAETLKRLMQFDKNGDGKLDANEVRGPLKARFEKLDADANGVLDEAELKRAVQRFSKAKATGNPNPDLSSRLQRLENKLNMKKAKAAKAQ